MKINNISPNSLNTNFKGMDALSKTLYLLQNNDMLNAAAVDVFAMDTPRTLVEYKYRGKNAGREMGFREFTGTFIAEFSAALFAFLTSKILTKTHKPEIKTNSSSWATNNSIDVFNKIYESSDKTTVGFVNNVLDSMKGISGKNEVDFKNISKENLVQEIVDLIEKPQDKKQFAKVQDNIIRLIKADNNITIEKDGSVFSSNLNHALRDMVDLSKNVFFNKEVDTNSALSKLKEINKSKVAFAIPLSMAIAITNQYINRKITKKKTGIDNFVGENGYDKNVKEKNQKDKQKGLWWKKMLSAGVFLFMLTKVMNLKNPADLVNKLEFTGPATSGNTIKTVYGTLILGRILASKDTTELRETTVRDYLGFLSWLVLGGFVAKGVAQAFDPKQEYLFNITKQGTGIKHWLNDVQIKSQKEIMASGGDIAKNLKKLNIAQLSGIAYSAVMLGVLLPKLNIWMTRKNKNDDSTYTKVPAFMGMDEYIKNKL